MNQVTPTLPLLLVIDNDPITRTLLTKVLGKSDYRVISADSGPAGLDAFGQQTPDLVLLDVMMPGMDGYETCRRLRTLPQGVHTPIIMLTGLEDAESIDTAFEAGASDFIPKPINWSLLAQRIKFVLRAHDTEALLNRLSLHDRLTDLPNRGFFMELLTQSLQRSRQDSRRHLAVMTLDIDRFKLFNQSLGETGGDELLCAVAERLVRISRDGDAVARLGSDEFAVLLDLQPDDHIDAMASRYHRSLNNAFSIHQQETFITPSIGVALAPEDSDTPQGLLAAANIAKTRAKKAGGNQFQFYTASMNEQASRRLKLENDLRRALTNGQMQVYYQPKIRSRGLSLAGAEALVRWQHPELGMISPVDFIPIAEETGLILDIGRWVLLQACQQSAQWRRHLPGFHIGVNLSARQFLQDDLVAQVADTLSATHLPASALDLEITESLAMSDAERNIAILHDLKKLGVHLSIDDFGTGYSSLSYLQAFPVNTIKIDRSFIMRIGTEQGSKADEGIAAAILAMAHSLDMSVVAEGVENIEQVQFLSRHGCQLLQGFHFGRPMPAQDFAQRFPVLNQP